MNENNNNDFLPVISKEMSKNRAKQNPLYFVLSQPINLNVSSAVKIKIQHVEEFNKQVYYIELLGNPTSHIYSGYAFDQRHLTIHKYYKEQNQNFKNGLSPAHYTEVYLSLVDTKQIVIHVYFDRHGFYKYIQIKQFGGKRQENNFIELEVNSYIENHIRENSKGASYLLKTILFQKDELYRSILNSANQIEEELETISLNLEKNSIKNYIISANKHIKILQDADNYSNDTHEKRIEIMKKQIEFLAEKYNSLCKEDSPNVETNLTLTEEQTITNRKYNKKKEMKKLLLNQDLINKSYMDILNSQQILINLTNRLKKSPTHIRLLIEQHEFIKEIQLKILTVSSFITLDQKNNLQKMIKALDLKNNINHLQEIFIDQFWKGELESVKLIYQSIGHLRSFTCEYNIYNALPEFKPDSKAHEQKFKATFDFLYKNSVFLKTHFDSQHVIMYFSMDEYTAITSALVRASLNNNLFIFKLLLEYGINPNSIGMIIGNIQTPAIYPIASEARPEFIQEAIKHGAHYSLETEHVTMDYKPGKKFSNSSPIATVKHLKQQEEILKENGFNTDILKCKNLIEWFRYQRSSPAIGYFVPQFKFEDLLYAFSLFTNRSEIITRHFLTSRVTGFRVIHNKNERAKITAGLLEIDPSKNLYSILFFSDQENFSLDHIEKISNELKCKFEFLLEHEPKVLEKICENLQMTNKQLSRLRANSDKDIPWQFAAYLFLLVLDPNPTAKTYQAIMQAYCFEAAYYKVYRPTYSLELYCRSKAIAESSCYANDLQITPLYEFICKHVPFNRNQNSHSNEGLLVEEAFIKKIESLLLDDISLDSNPDSPTL
jgi:hypothetical protein